MFGLVVGFGFAELGEGFFDGEGLFAVFAGVLCGNGLLLSNLLCFSKVLIINKHFAKVILIIVVGPFLIGVDLLLKFFADIFKVVRLAPVMLVFRLLFILISFENILMPLAFLMSLIFLLLISLISRFFMLLLVELLLT